MGVQGLWQLLEPTGKAISPEHLSGKVLAIDISMWLHQFSKGMRDSSGNPMPNAHLIGLFKRLCKLLFYGIKPVFVFDGAVPILKKQTISLRQRKRDQLNIDSKHVAKKLLRKLLQRHAIQNVVGVDLEKDKEKRSRPKKSNEADIFLLASNEYPLQNEERVRDAESSDHYDFGSDKTLLERYGFDKDIDFDSKEFQGLPNTLKLGMLLDFKERNKHSGWNNVDLLPEDADEFSGYQIQQLMKSNEITERIEKIRQEINKEANGLEENAGYEMSRIFSNADTRFVYHKKGGRYERQENIFGEMFCHGERALQDRIQAERSRGSGSAVGLSASETSENFYSHGIKYRLNESFMLVPNIAKEMEQRTSSLNFKCQTNHEENRGQKVLKLEEGSDEDDDLIEVKSPGIVDKPDDQNQVFISSEAIEMDQPSYDQKDISVANDSTDEVVKTLYHKIVEECYDVDKYVTKSANAVKQHDREGIVGLANHNVLMTAVASFGSDLSDSGNIFQINSSLKDSPSAIEYKLHPQITIMNDASISGLAKFENEGACVSSKNIGIDQINIDRMPQNDSEVDVSGDIKNDDEEDDDEEMNELLAEVLETCNKDTKEADLEVIETRLNLEVDQLKNKIGKNEREATSITEQMQQDAQDLLKLFGVPYLVSPAEAEAQCAFLDSSGQTNGTISDDSDVFLFGARKVVRHLFDRHEVAEMYSSDEIEKKLFLNRSNLICIAMLCGSDYTNGIRNVGPVTATEIIQEFKGQGLECLIQFRNWWLQAKKQKLPVNETFVKSQLRRLHLFDGFPNPSVFDAYENPSVDTSVEPFTWSPPELQLLERYAQDTLNWTKKQVDDMIVPLAKKLGNCSKHVTDYFMLNPSLVPLPSLGKKLKSKRVRRIINIRGTEKRKEDINEEPKQKRSLVNAHHVASKNGKRRAVMQEIALSEESSDAADDDVDDSILAGIDIDDMLKKAKMPI